MVQAVFPPVEKVLAGQADLVDVVAHIYPAGQGLQVVALACVYSPAAHATGVPLKREV